MMALGPDMLDSDGKLIIGSPRIVLEGNFEIKIFNLLTV